MQIRLRSKLLESASYEDETHFLRIALTNGQLREFTGVPRYIFEELSAARSPGSYYMKYIRGQFAQTP